MPRVVRSTVIAEPVETIWAILRDFNGHDQWHPAVAESTIERGQTADRVGCVRRFRLADGSELREKLLTLSDADMAFSYVAHVRLAPVTDGDQTFWHWESRFDTPKGREAELTRLVGEEIYNGGFNAIRGHLAERVR
jgi:uncharacterized protein YndB with AHSA1/START domain